MSFFSSQDPGRQVSQPSAVRSNSKNERFGSTAGFFDVAKQQCDLITWVGSKIQEHESKIDKLCAEIKALADGTSIVQRKNSKSNVQRKSSPNPLDHGEHSLFEPKRWRAASPLAEKPDSDQAAKDGSGEFAGRESNTSGQGDSAKDGERSRPASSKGEGNDDEAQEDSADIEQRDSSKDDAPDGELAEDEKKSRLSKELSVETDLDEDGERAETKQSEKRHSQRSAGNHEDIDSKLNDFSEFMMSEMQRLDGAILEEMESRIQDAISEAIQTEVQDMMTQKMQGMMEKFADEVEGLVDDKISSAMPSGMATEGYVDAAVDAAMGGIAPQEASEEEAHADVPAVQVTAPDAPADEAGSAIVSGLAPGIVAAGGGDKNMAQLNNAVRQLRAEMTQKLPLMEERLNEMKPICLQVPSLQSDLENLSMSVMQIAQAMEEGTPSAGTPACGISEAISEVGRQTSGFGDSDDDFGDDGAAVGAHTVRVPSKRPQPSAGKPNLSNMMGAYMHNQGDQSGVGQEAFDALVKRVDKCEGGSAAIDKCMDMEQLVNILEDRVKELDAEHRAHRKEFEFRLSLMKTDEEKENASAAKVYESWDLANQVDVIQSIITGEMRGIRIELDESIKKALADTIEPKRGSAGQISRQQSSADSPTNRGRANSKSAVDEPRPRSNTPTKSIEDMEEKLKRLQDAYQQATLKIAGLKSASRHTDHQVTHVMEQLKKVATEVEESASRSIKNETRLDYFAIHGAGRKEAKAGEQPSFAAAVQQASPRPSALIPPSPAGRSTSGFERQVSHSNPERQTSTATPHHPRVSRRLSTGASSMNLGKDRQVSSESLPLIGHASEQTDINTGRIRQLGKKVTDLDGDMNGQVEAMRKEMQIILEKTNMITSFLPRRLRRMVERLLLLHKKDDHDGEDPSSPGLSPKRSDSSAKSVNFSAKSADVRTYNMDDVGKEGVPWQMVGEPEAKWSWCLQPRNEMGRDLARYFETLEHEKEELEESLSSQVDQLRNEILQRLESGGQNSRPSLGGGRPAPIIVGRGGEEPMSPMSTANLQFQAIRSGGLSPRSPTRTSQADWSAGAPDAVDKLSRQVQRIVMPQLQTMEERIERIVKDMGDVKKSQESDSHKKADKEEVALLRMRIAPFEHFDPKPLAVKLENFEVDGKHYLHLIDQLAEQVRNVEGYAAHRADVTKVRAEFSGLKTELQKLAGEQKEASSTVYHSNRQMSTIVLDTKGALEKSIIKLEIEKLPVTEYASLLEKVAKLEHSMRDNRQILSDSGGGTEVNHMVKRIILNMEDKIMLLEKKLEAILEGRTAGENFASAVTTRPNTSNAGINEGVSEAVGLELSTISQAVGQLKQDINLSKVSMDQIREQEIRSTEMAQRLNIIIDDGEVDTTLSLSRVQVMVAAAARQLVAGSKWVTQEMFDARMTEMKREFFGFMREAQTQIEDMQEHAKVMYSATGASVPRKLPNVPRKLPSLEAGNPDGGWEVGDDFGNTSSKAKTAPNFHPGVVKGPLKFSPQNAPGSARGPGRKPPGSAPVGYR